MELNMNSMVSYEPKNDAVVLDNRTMSENYCSDGTGDGAGTYRSPFFEWDYWRTCPETIKEWFPTPIYYGTTKYEDTYKKAFSIAKLLLKEKFLVSRKLKDFIGLVEKIAKELE